MRGRDRTGISGSALVVAVAILHILPASGQLVSNTIQCPGSVREACECYATIGYNCPSGFYCPYAPGTFNGTLPADSGCVITSGGLLQCACTPGMYCPANTAQPVYCCTGHYCPTPSSMFICPEGSFCLQGFVEAVSCKPTNDCPEGSDSEDKLSSLIFGHCGWLWLFCYFLR